jgi:hypothetical protein
MADHAEELNAHGGESRAEVKGTPSGKALAGVHLRQARHKKEIPYAHILMRDLFIRRI